MGPVNKYKCKISKGSKRVSKYRSCKIGVCGKNSVPLLKLEQLILSMWKKYWLMKKNEENYPSTCLQLASTEK